MFLQYSGFDYWMWFRFSPGSSAGVIAGVIAPQLSHHALKFASVNERVVFPAPSVWGQVSYCCLCLRPNSSTEYPPFSESLRGTGDSAPNGDLVVLLGDFKAHVVFLLDFCASHTLFTINTMFMHKGVHQCIWHQDTLSGPEVDD